MDRLIKAGTADVSVHLYIIDSTDGTPETGVVFNEAGIDLKYRREGAAVVAIVEADLVTPLLTDAHLDGGFLEVGNGVYRLDLPDAACAAGVKHVTVFGTITGMIVLPVEIQLVAFDPDDTVRLGLTSLANAAAEAPGGMYTRGVGAGQINQPANGVIDANAISAVAAFFQDCFTVDSGEVSGAEVGGSLILEIAKVVWDRVLTGGTHNIATSAGRRLRAIQDFQGYENGAVWIDTVNGTAGTTDFENGTVENPVDTIADALTIAASVGLVHFEVATGSSITLGANVDGKTFSGRNWTLVLNNQSCSDSVFVGATVSGICTGAAKPRFERCVVNAVTLPPTIMLTCGLANTITVGSLGDFFFLECFSLIAGTGTPTLDFGAAVGNTNVSFRSYSGGIEIENMGGAGADTMSLEGHGQLIINANCGGGTVAIRGNFTVTDNAGGAVALSDDARIDVGQINAEADTALSDYDPPTKAEMDAAHATTDALIAALNDLSAAEVNAEVVDALNVDTYAEPGQAAPAATASVVSKLGYLYKNWRNKKTEDATSFKLYDDASAVVDQKATVSDAAGLSTKGEIAAGP